MADGIYTNTAEIKRQSGMGENQRIDEENMVEIHMNTAEAEIDSTLAGRYVLPLSSNATYAGSSAEKLLKGYATILACGFLADVQYQSQGGDLSDFVNQKLTMAKKFLQRLAGNCKECPEIILLGTDGLELGITDSGGNTVTGYPNATTDTDLPADNPNASFTKDMKF